ncbi:protein kinase [Pseudenhygromyxa sp. WMMC2535]|uniref:serine/threonine-protein kinase n=1 Tax=Pseudenhygromyxa sp. WMMC2535 TaxID=2712867 RepID=UPI001556D4ED|nr:serine/threonine-protein kinase [Pseudenhygromyxa sp. WMMC2535]NVB38717.1 protein kinase [Pseudenhygromyxa sp. WMMC2535]
MTIQDRYRIESLIGTGAMGRVYRAEQTALRKPFAIKILSPQLTNDPDSQARFANEAHNAASLNHPNVVSVVDYGRTKQGVTFLVMEYIEGRSLEQIIQDEHPLERARIADLILQILAALTEAHGLGILHRDLKPENILIQSLRTRGELLKVLDFGIAKLMDDAPAKGARPGLTSQGVVCGTPEYMSPEQACGLHLDQRSDLYAVGIILYQMLTGRPPFESESAVEILHRHIHELPRPPSQVLGAAPDPLEAVCLRALAKERDARYADAGEFRDAVLKATRVGTATEIHCAKCSALMRPSDRFCAACGAQAPDQPLAASGQRRVARRSTRALRQSSGEATAEVLLRALPQRLAGEAANALLAAAQRRLDNPKVGLQAQAISGPAGSGKTRLLDEIADQAEERGWRVLAAGCEPTGAMTALWPIRQAIGQLLEVDPRAPSPGDLGRAANLIGLSYEALPGLNELFGLGVSASAVEYAVRRRECFTSAVQALTEGAAGNPLLLVFDDVDRWDAPSRRIVQQLVRARAEAPVLILLATAEEQREWLRCPVVELPRLDAGEVRQWAAALSHEGSPLPDRLASHVPLTPFELELALRCVPVEGEPIDLPTALEDWLIGLAANERQLLELCAVIGENVERSELEALCPRDPRGDPCADTSLDALLASLIQAGLLAAMDRDQWALRNRRIRDQLLAGIERERLRLLHREAAICTERAQLSPTVRALHLLRAQPSRARDAADRVQAVELIEALREAAVASVAAFDDPKAVRLLRTALKACRRLPGEDRLNHEANLIADLVDPFCFTDRVDEAIYTLRKLLGSGTMTDAESELQRALGRCLARKRDWKGAVDAYQRALGPLIAQGRRSALLELYADLARSLDAQGEHQRALSELEEGLDMCTLGDGPRANVDVSMWRYLLTASELQERRGELREARTWAEHALFQAERRGEDLGRMRGHETLGRLLRALKQNMLAEQHIGRGLEIARKLGDRRTSAELLVLRAKLRAAAKRFEEAHRCLDESERLSALLEWQRGLDRVTRVRKELPG